MNGDCLKFRVWDKKNSEYVPEGKSCDVHCFLWRDGTLDCGISYDDGFAGGIDWVKTEDATIEHCTGKKDKNGKLIYEGDIVQYNNQECGTVIFREGCWVWDWKVNDPPLYMLEQKYLKVVGNIHEVENECKDK